MNRPLLLALAAVTSSIPLCFREGSEAGPEAGSPTDGPVHEFPPDEEHSGDFLLQLARESSASPDLEAPSLSDPEVLEQVRRLYAQHADAWHAEWLQAEADDQTGTRWLNRVLDRFVRNGGSPGPFALDANDFCMLDQQQMATLGDYLHHGLGWLERTKGMDPEASGGALEKAFQALRDQPLSFDPMQALALLGADPDLLPLDAPELLELAEARKRLLVLAAPSLTFVDESEHFAYDAMTLAGIPIEEAIREDVTLVVPDIRVHRQILADLEQEYFDLLLQTATVLEDSKD